MGDPCMEILIATDAWHPQVNGVVRTLSTTLDQLGAMGWKARVIHPGMFSHFTYPFYADIKLAFATRKRMDAIVGRHPPGFVHIATEGPVGWAMRSLCIQKGWAFSTAFHTNFPEYLAKFPGVPRSWTWNILRRFHSASSRTMVATHSIRQQLIAEGFDPNRLVFWGRGVDTQLFQPKPKSLRTKPIAIYVGRVSAEKSIEDFLGVDRPVQKWVVGDGPDRIRLQRKYPGARWFGWQKGENLAKLYADADVFVFPSRTDTFGLVMIEAMACGLPVAAYPVPGPVDIVIPGTGALGHDLGSAMDEALTCEPGYCREYAETHSWEKCTRQFLRNLVVATEQVKTETLVA